MIAKKYQGLLYIFEKINGMTAVFSGQELKLLTGYAETNKKTPFIRRLYDLGILADKNHRKIIKQALQDDVGISLEALHVELTDNCPLACPQCYKNCYTANDMDFAIFEKLVRQAQQLKIFQIALGGGEPLVYHNIEEAVQLVAATQMAVSLTTGGYGLTECLIKKLITAGLNHMQVSLNSVDERINALSRDGYKHAIAAINLLSDSSLSFGINYVARQDNLDGFVKLADYAREKGADNVNVLRYKPANKEDFQRNALSIEQTQKLVETISRIKGIKGKIDSAYSQLLVYLYKDRTDPLRSGCGAGKNFLAVTPMGWFSPCSHLPLAKQSESISSYIASQELQDFQTAQNDLTNLCGQCLYRNLCGGCRAVCLALSGKIDSGEQHCLAFEEG